MPLHSSQPTLTPRLWNNHLILKICKANTYYKSYYKASNMDVTVPELHDLKHGWFIGRILLFNGVPQNIYTISAYGYLKLVSTNFCQTTSEIQPVSPFGSVLPENWPLRDQYAQCISKHKATFLYSWKNISTKTNKQLLQWLQSGGWKLC